MRTEIIHAGAAAAQGPCLRIDAAFSFWGGVDPATSTITDPRLGAHGARIAQTILFIGDLRGSSSTSAVLLELIHRRIAPAAIIIPAVDAILVLGCLVGQEMGWDTPPIATLPLAHHAAFAQGAQLSLHPSGALTQIS